ncbi:hypothetical protein [Adonisia turfae]|nr:hypothetical protein [Adonisia turfae]
MAIFPRRVVQKCLDEIRSLNLLPEEKLTRLIQKELNSSDPVKSIACEWEVIILSALSKVSRIEYEKNFIEGGRTPDVFCGLPSGTCFLADITTVSDRAAHKENPAHYFFQQVREFLSRRGVSSTAGIDIRIGGDSVGKYGDQKAKLALPQKGDIPRFINQNLSSFAKDISSNESAPRKFSIDDGTIKVQVTYAPDRGSSGGGYPSYTSFYSPTRNPIFNKLEQKAKQLKESGFSGITGIFICDGWCASLHNVNISPDEFSQDTVIQNFFKGNQRVSFVLTLTPEEKHSAISVVMRNKLKFFQNPNADYPVTSELIETLNLMGQQLPKPESMLINALQSLKGNSSTGLSHYGGYIMEGDMIKISSRTLVELLAGILDVDKFIADHFGYVNENSQASNFFRNKILSGKMIENIELERSEDEDDDWVVIKFGESDPALSPYR